jgi:hypothetical protein
MASFVPQNSPSNLSILDLSSYMNSLGGPAKQCRFAVRIMPSGSSNILTRIGYNNFIKDMTYLCEATELPGRGFDIASARYYGPAINFPRNSKYGEGIDMTFLCRTESFERQMFDDWMEVINPSNIYDFNYAKDYYAEIQIFQLAEYNKTAGSRSSSSIKAPTATYAWSIHKAWPMVVNPQAVTWADNDVLRLSVTFAYQSWTRPGRDTPAGQGNINSTMSALG